MPRKTALTFWRLAAAAALALAAIPWIRAMWPAAGPRMAVAAGEEWTVPGEVVVDARDTAGPGQLAALAARYGAALEPTDLTANGGRIVTLRTSPALVPALLARLRSDPLVETAEPQRLVRAFRAPNDPRYGEQWNFQRIDMEKAWEVTRGNGATVAVIDTGVALGYGDGGHLCRDFGGVRFAQPYDFVNRSRTPSDDHGHGTHVAGTIAEATDNNEGVAGIAYEATLMPLKVLTRDGFGRMSDVAAAIRYAADNGANVINMSLGGPFPDSVTRNACKYAHAKGVTIVCAAGNGGGEGVGYPAAYPECIAVSALGPSGKLAPYSSWGPQVALSAPGGDKTQGEQAGILQNTFLRMPGGADEPGSASAAGAQVDDYYWFQGTSMATPHVAGVAALVSSLGIRDPEEVRAVLLKSARPRGPSEKYGAGELNAAAAVRVGSAEGAGHTSRLWAVGFMAVLGAALSRSVRRRGRRAIWAAALAMSVGLLFPDVVSAFVGFSSVWNLLGHSILLPGYLLVAEAESGAERRFYGLFAGGLALHLACDLVMGTAPIAGNLVWAALPWLGANAAVGFGAAVASLRGSR